MKQFRLNIEDEIKSLRTDKAARWLGRNKMLPARKPVRLDRTVAMGNGRKCPKCHQPMQRYRRGDALDTKLGRLGFGCWDVCRPCGLVKQRNKLLARMKKS